MKAKCKYFGQCGGCQLQKSAYEEQLRKKEQKLSELFGQQVTVRAHPSPYSYRNRMDFVCTPKAIGLRRQGEWDSIVDVQRCEIQDEEMNIILTEIRQWIADHNIDCYDLHKQTGFLRYVMLRKGEGMQVTITTFDDTHEDEITELVNVLHVDSFIWTINNSKRDESVGKQVHKIFGLATIPMQILDKTFCIDQHTFFQASPHAVALAIETMRSYIGSEILYDLYCGVGVLGICLSKGKLIGVDTERASIERAKENAALNNLDAQYYRANVATWLAGKQLETVVVDPPRTGLGIAATQLKMRKPKKIIYLSCNPVTQKRDIVALGNQYKLIHLEGFDFFPQTDHIECLAVLERI